MFHGHLDYFPKPPLGGRPNTKPGDHGTPNAHNRWFILFYHVWGPAWIEIHWNSIWLRARSHMTSHYTWGPVTTLHDFGGVLGWPLDTFFWALAISWSRLLACVWSGPRVASWNLLIHSIQSDVEFFHRLSLALTHLSIHKWQMLTSCRFRGHWILLPSNLKWALIRSGRSRSSKCTE